MQKRRVERRMFFKSLQFPKVSAKNIHYCGQNPGETDIAHMVSDFVIFVSHALNLKRRFVDIASDKPSFRFLE